MKVDDIRAKTVDELTTLIADLKREALNLRFQKATHELAQFSRMKQVRRTIARALTIRNEKQREAAGGSNA